MVGLVQHRDGDGVQPNLALAHQVLQASGGGNDDVDALAQSTDLAGLADAAEDGHHTEPGSSGERLDGLEDLVGELAGRCQHEAAGRAGTRASGARGRDKPGEPGDQRQGERERLAGAGAAASEDVAAGERVGKGGGLDREGCADAAREQRVEQHGGDAEGRE